MHADLLFGLATVAIYAPLSLPVDCLQPAFADIGFREHCCTPIGVLERTMERFKMIFIVFILACAGVARGELVLSLDSKDWTMVNENGTLSLTTNVPAYPLEVLRSQGVIGDPLYR